MHKEVDYGCKIRIGKIQIKYWYEYKNIENGLSSTILELKIESCLMERTGNCTNNFFVALPPLESDMAKKDDLGEVKMAITEKDEELIEYGFIMAFLPDLPRNSETVNKALVAWNQLWKLMERENNFSIHLGSNVLDWQIGNWANDLTMLLHNAGKYKELIAVNEQILQIEWGNKKDTSLFHENAKRDIANAYADMGNIEKAYALYREYLGKDSLWGWGWIGYYRLLKYNDEMMFRDVIEELYQKIKKGIHFRDMDDLCSELADEFNTLGEYDKSDYLADKYEVERKKETAQLAYLLKKKGFGSKKIDSFGCKKIYPNEPCPCGSGKKYKKCCARK